VEESTIRASKWQEKIMDDIKKMATMQARKAFVASILAMIGVATLSTSGAFTLIEILTIVGTGLATFQATYWTTNETKADGEIVVKEDGEKKVFSLELESDPEDLEKKKQVVLKVNKKKPNEQHL